MTEPNTPYTIKPPKGPLFEQQKVIQIKEDAPRMPSSVGTDSFQATIFGAPALQPSKSTESAKGFSCGALMILTILFLPLVFALFSWLKGL